MKLPPGFCTLRDLIGSRGRTYEQSVAERRARLPAEFAELSYIGVTQKRPLTMTEIEVLQAAGLERDPRLPIRRRPGLIPLDAAGVHAEVAAGRLPVPLRGPWGLAWPLDSVYRYRRHHVPRN